MDHPCKMHLVVEALHQSDSVFPLLGIAIPASVTNSTSLAIVAITTRKHQAWQPPGHRVCTWKNATHQIYGKAWLSCVLDDISEAGHERGSERLKMHPPVHSYS